jgi:tripartite-type tricarboxylate transporter receptor subunit TctC
MMTALPNRLCAAAILCAASVAAAGSAAAQSPGEFYKGKSINLVIGYTVGGGYDLYARLLAKHIAKYIPGNPSVVPQNMPGAASLKSVEHLVSVAPKDGTSIATFSQTMAVQPLLGGAKFDPKTFEWLGSITSETSVCISWHTSPVKTWDDLSAKQWTAGGTGKGSDPDMLATLLQTVFKLPIKLVSGYPGTNEIILAAERGEVDGFCGLSYSTILSRYNKWLEEKQINLLVQAAVEKDPALPNVPLVLDLAKDDRQRQMLILVVAAQKMARPFAMPPGTPKERADVVRAAFKSTMEDKEFLDDAKKARAEVRPIYAEQIQALLKQIYATPPDVVNETIKALE